MTIRNAEHARSRPMTEPPATARGARSADTDDWDPDSELSETSKAVIATVFGLALLIAAFAVIGRLGGWAADYGTILVYLAFFLWMSIAGRVFWWGADKLIAEARKKSNTGDRR
ncbi:hypothetical protein JXX30_01520 [Rhodococcus erythropolis]|jgi:predicted cobalt transporter CbtA|uniref:hypothetical protein n=2 Tax=Nocardiaceae TaxID=85025 RepID=UPI00197F3436|nr:MULTISPECIES: hypothetical protein [Rhodococcus]MBW0286599.1 hypothetical protein [Rhodococcus sp. FH8]MCW2298655.1 putative cobalt transporter CbtA [Rhodococcus erythropolis]MCZ4615117.1 hypothetical protein [Rhodococcus qingshengii]MDJ0106807.1 hypothetical protein [Rhodococcus erythropolis]QSE41539.1 hypothetical protein JXX30_01520 [Rhodococcus erythropolis]